MIYKVSFWIYTKIMNTETPPYKPRKMNLRRLSPYDLFQPVVSDFGENITYIEYLVGLGKLINECIDYLDYIDKKYTGWQDQIDQIKSDLDALAVRLTQEVNKLNITIREGDSQTLLSAKVYTDGEAARLQDQINNITSKLNPVYDPTTGYVLPVQVVVMNVYEAGRYDAITAKEYDSLELTAAEYDSKELTSKQYDQHGKSILMN